MHFKVNNCFDSHVHWAMSGQSSTTLSLKNLHSPQEVAGLKPQAHHFRGDWLLGFGWDQNTWDPATLPTRQTLDTLFPNHPVAFGRIDGHALWLNSEALRRADLLGKPIENPQGGVIVRDEQGIPTGVLLDLAMDRVKSHIPKPNKKELQRHLIEGQRYFHSRGFTHIRDMSCSQEQWEALTQLSETEQLTLAVEQYFDSENPNRFNSVLQLAHEAKRAHLPLVRVKGVKVFYDGALGSEGALLSCSYCSGSGNGFRLMDEETLREIMIRTWEKQLDLAVHVIGDEAAHQVVHTAHTLWNGNHHSRGRLHLEHAQMMRPETIALLENQNVTCHMQPCHWLSDRRWLKAKVGSLFPFVFPWQALENKKVAIHFGSDSPIEESSIFNTLTALKDSVSAGVPALKEDPLKYLQHPDPNWTPDTYSVFRENKVETVFFRGKSIS